MTHEGLPERAGGTRDQDGFVIEIQAIGLEAMRFHGHERSCLRDEGRSGDIRQWRAWSFPLLVVGMNSIAMYCMEMLLRPWTAKTLQTHLGQDFFKVVGPANAPFVQATLVGLVFWLVCFWMYRRKIFLRI